MKKKLVLILTVLLILIAEIPLVVYASTQSTGRTLPDSYSITGPAKVEVGASITLGAAANGGYIFTVIKGPDFSTQDTDIIRIQGNTVTGLKPGTATVELSIECTAHTGVDEGNCAGCDCDDSNVYSNKTYTPTITIVVGDPFPMSNVALYVGEGKQAQVTLPEALKSEAQTWIIADTSVAKVNAYGRRQERYGNRHGKRFYAVPAAVLR